MGSDGGFFKSIYNNKSFFRPIYSDKDFSILSRVKNF